MASIFEKGKEKIKDCPKFQFHKAIIVDKSNSKYQNITERYKTNNGKETYLFSAKIWKKVVKVIAWNVIAQLSNSVAVSNIDDVSSRCPQVTGGEGVISRIHIGRVALQDMRASTTETIIYFFAILMNNGTSWIVKDYPEFPKKMVIFLRITLSDFMKKYLWLFINFSFRYVFWANILCCINKIQQIL